MDYVFDIGGTKMRVGRVIDDRLEMVDVRSTEKNYELGIKNLAEMLKDASSVAGGIAGRWNQDKSMLLGSPNLVDWVGKPIKADLEKLLNCNVILENDAAVAGIGEARYGAGKGKRIVGYLCFGTGVGGARIVDGELDVNYDGFEPGTMIVDYPNTLETMIKEGKDESKWLEVAMANVWAMWSQEIIIVGGGLGLRMKLPDDQTVIRAGLGDESGLYGAMYLRSAGKTAIMSPGVTGD